MHTLTAAEAAESIRRGEFSAAELMSALLAHSREVEPDLHVWAMLDEDAAMATAHARDAELAAEGARGPLHGVPVGVKDIYHTRAMRTMAASPILADFVPEDNAVAVSRMLAAGAIVMGKTVTTQFACGDPPPTRNAWNAERTPGGSSSGSAVGVSAGCFPLALGSQTGGSILRPAAYNGVVGVKPTFGRIDRRGVIAVAESLDTMGHFARTVEDAALLFDALSGAGSDSETESTPTFAPRIGLLKTFFWDRADSESIRNADRAARTLADAGAQIEEVEVSIHFDRLLSAHRTLMTSEAARVHGHWFTERADDYAPNVRSVIETGLRVSAVDYLGAKQFQRGFTAEISAEMAPYDALMTPSTPSSAPSDLSTTGDPMFQAPFTFGGFPAITLPSGLDSTDMPLGIQLSAASGADRRLLAVAEWCEKFLEKALNSR